MVEVNKTTIVTGATIFSIIAIVMAYGLIGQDNVYVCQDLNLAMQCPEGLSKINADGIQTQCKFFSEELNRSTYKVCKTGWLPYKPEVKTDLIEENIINSSNKQVYLLCEQTNEFIKNCQIINSNKTLYQIG